MEITTGIKIIHARTRKAWRSWLEKNHAKANGVWLVMFRKKSRTTGVDYVAAVEEALCFGWIDGIKKKRDAESSIQFFTKRKPKGNWSESNRVRVKRLIKEGLMTPAGQAMIDLAKKTGTWRALMDSEKGVIPPDLKKLLDQNAKASENFTAFPPSSKQIILGWIASAKKTDTRQKRIEQTVALAEKNIRANHYKPKTA